MTAITSPRVLGETTTVGSGLSRLSARFAAWRLRVSATEATRRELSALSDRDLADIGVARADIDRVARSAAAQF